MSKLGCALIVGLVALTGCEGLKGRGKYLTGPDAFEWESDIRFRVRGQKKMWGQASAVGQELSLFVKGFPPGTTLTLGDGKAVVNDDGDGSLKASAASLLGGVAFRLENTTTLENMTFTVQAPGGQPIKVQVPPQTVYIESLLREIEKGPLSFGEPAGQEGPIRNILWVDWTRDNPLFGDKPATFKDLDALAMVKRPDGPTKMCGGYKFDDGRPAPDIKLKLSETVVTVYVRRTGKVHATKTFPAVDECPSFATGGRNEKLERDSPLPEADVRAWLESLLAPPPAEEAPAVPDGGASP